MGRTWSIFHGIIGRVWRSKEKDYLHLKKLVSIDESEALRVIKLYSMTRDQLRYTAKGRVSFLAVPLKDPETKEMLGVFYIDSKTVEAFGSKDSDSPEKIQEFISDTLKPLIPKLKDYRDDYVRKGPDIKILGT